MTRYIRGCTYSYSNDDCLLYLLVTCYKIFIACYSLRSKISLFFSKIYIHFMICSDIFKVFDCNLKNCLLIKVTLNIKQKITYKCVNVFKSMVQ